MLRHLLVGLWIGTLAAGCAPGAGSDHGKATGPAGHGGASAAGDLKSHGRILAYVAGREVTVEALLPRMIESVGGPSLSDAVLEVMLERRLKSSSIQITPPMVEAEREILKQTLDEDPDQATRLLNELRERRGLGETRYADLLWRNAGLRALVADSVRVTEAAKQREYRLRHGPSARLRLLMTEQMGEAQRLRQTALQLNSGSRFGELAALHSVDESAAQGGLLPWIRPDDTSFPAALRDAAEKLEVDQISDVITLGVGFAVVRLEARRAGDGLPYAEVERQLEVDVRRRAERVLMEQTARELAAGAKVVVLDPALKKQWDRQRQTLAP